MALPGIERCPVCRARLRDASVCPRCESDLTMLLQIEKQAAAYEQQAICYLSEGDVAAARDSIARALHLRHSRFAESLMGFIVEMFARRE